MRSRPPASQRIRADRDACVCSGNFHKGTVWGELEVELDDAAPGQTRLSLIATAAKDNIWTVLKGDPTERIIDRFVRCLPPAESSPSALVSSVAGELERLSELHEQGRLSDEEYRRPSARRSVSYSRKWRLRSTNGPFGVVEAIWA